VKGLFRRPARPAPTPVRDVTEAEIAVGSLAGIAPSEIDRHVLIVVSTTGTVAVSGTACRETTTLILAEILAQYAREAQAEHACGGGS
jgi:hypothetical protein